MLVKAQSERLIDQYLTQLEFVKNKLIKLSIIEQLSFLPEKERKGIFALILPLFEKMTVKQPNLICALGKIPESEREDVLHSTRPLWEEPELHKYMNTIFLEISTIPKENREHLIKKSLEAMRESYQEPKYKSCGFIFQTLKSFSPEQMDQILSIAWPLIKGTDLYNRSLILNAVGSIPQEHRTHVVEDALALSKSLNLSADSLAPTITKLSLLKAEERREIYSKLSSLTKENHFMKKKTFYTPIVNFLVTNEMKSCRLLSLLSLL